MAEEKTFAVFGLGTFGFEVCRVLAEKGGKVIAIDVKQNLIEKAKDIATQAVLIDSTDEDSLKNAPLESVDVAIVAMGDDMEASILTTAILKNIGVPYIITRAISDIHAQVLKQVGATEVLFIEIEEGRQLATRLIAPDVLDRIPISKNQTLAEIVVPESFVGKTLQKLDLINKFNITVISVKRVKTTIDDMGNPQKEEIIIQPVSSTILAEGDIVVVIGKDEDINALKEY
ncbi:MAG: TrkA family potassium uptake protein [Spirochaetota bacterium]|nr:MAG: TrkA family potassium uptake protein [Spirochaetota bacterium]